MKKLSIVLLAFLFAAGSIFAAELTVEGDVTASISADLDTPSFGFDPVDDGLDADFSFSWASGEASSEGSGNLYAVLEGSAFFDVFISDGTSAYTDADGDVYDYVLADWGVGVDTFDIYAGDFVIDLLGAPEGFSNAQSFDFSYGDDENIDEVEGAFPVNNPRNGGVSVSYQEDYLVGLDFWYEEGLPGDDLLYLVYAGTTGLTVADGLDLTVAAGIDNVGVDATVAGSYVMTDLGTVNLALDTADNFGAFDASADIAFEQIAEMLTPELAVYFYNDGATSDLYIHTGSDVAMDFGTVAFNFDAKALLTSWELYADASTTVDAIALSAYGSYAETNVFTLGGSVGYTYDVWTISAGADFDSSDSSLGLNAGVETGSLIDNATVGLGWESNDIANEAGVITASVTASL